MLKKRPLSINALKKLISAHFQDEISFFGAFILGGLFSEKFTV